MTEIDSSNNNCEAALRYYKRHLQRVLIYQKANPKKANAKSKRYHDRIKKDDREKYQARLSRMREYALTRRKTQKEKEKETALVLETKE